MYRIEDIDKIDKNINKIKNEVSMYYKENYEPTLTEISSVYKVILDYIKTNKKIVYGGYAQNLLIMQKNPNDTFYKEINGVFYNWPDVADIEFYSTNPKNDVINLVNKLHDHGFKHIKGKGGVHEDTYKIFVNFINYSDISFMESNIYNNIPTIDINGILCCHPHFMAIDGYRILTDPLTSYWRLDKTIYRFQKLLKYYPFIENNEIIENIIINPNTDITHNKILKLIRKKLVQKTNLIVVGLEAYNYYIKKVSKNEKVNIPYYELISSNFDKDSKHIFKHLTHKFDKITKKEIKPFFTFLDNTIEYYYNDKLILKLYGNNYRCIVYNYSDKKRTHYGTFSLVFMYLLFNYFYYYVNKDNKMKIYQDMIKKLYKYRNDYLNYNDITVVDKSPFQDFTYKCYGHAVDQLRESLISNKNKFIYQPSKNT